MESNSTVVVMDSKRKVTIEFIKWNTDREYNGRVIHILKVETVSSFGTKA